MQQVQHQAGSSALLINTCAGKSAITAISISWTDLAHYISIQSTQTNTHKKTHSFTHDIYRPNYQTIQRIHRRAFGTIGQMTVVLTARVTPSGVPSAPERRPLAITSATLRHKRVANENPSSHFSCNLNTALARAAQSFLSINSDRYDESAPAWLAGCHHLHLQPVHAAEIAEI